MGAVLAEFVREVGRAGSEAVNELKSQRAAAQIAFMRNVRRTTPARRAIARSRERRHVARATSGVDPGDSDPSHQPSVAPLRLVPRRVVLTFACVSAETRGQATR